jgi:hypothetical protein
VACVYRPAVSDRMHDAMQSGQRMEADCYAGQWALVLFLFF